MDKPGNKKYLFEIEIGNKKEEKNKFPIIIECLKLEGVKVIKIIELIN